VLRDFKPLGWMKLLTAHTLSDCFLDAVECMIATVRNFSVCFVEFMIADIEYSDWRRRCPSLD
jgi:hypothetical protein